MSCDGVYGIDRFRCEAKQDFQSIVNDFHDNQFQKYQQQQRDNKQKAVAQSWLAAAESEVEEIVHDEELAEITKGATDPESSLFKLGAITIVVLIIIIIWTQL